jgi:hypothetical protein
MRSAYSLLVAVVLACIGITAIYLQTKFAYIKEKVSTGESIITMVNVSSKDALNITLVNNYTFNIDVRKVLLFYNSSCYYFYNYSLEIPVRESKTILVPINGDSCIKENSSFTVIIITNIGTFYTKI